MNAPSRFPRPSAGLFLALIGLMTGFITPGYGQDLPLAGVRAKAQGSDAHWTLTGGLNTARVGHTATLLPNGKVLVTGGYEWDGLVGHEYIELDSAELYDPATGTWSVTGRMNAKHWSHTATLLPDGQVLVVGGFPEMSYVDSKAELYDPGSGTWRRTATQTSPLNGHTATLLQNGKVLIARGFGPYGSIPEAVLYDPVSGNWSSTGSLRTGRLWPQATLLRDGRVLVTGGSIDYGAIMTAELYDPAAGSWSDTGPVNFSGQGDTATRLPSGLVLIAGGLGVDPSSTSDPERNDTAELFDPATGMWSKSGSLNSGRRGHTASLLPNGEVLVAGGLNVFSIGSDLLVKASELYDAGSAHWDYTADINVPREAHTATVLTDGRVLVAGGVGSAGTLNSAELYEQALAPGPIGPGFTGAWFDPAQSGHGLFIEVLPTNHLLAGWFAFNPAGTQQAWFVGVGTYSGNTATITVVSLPAGGALDSELRSEPDRE